MIAASATHFIVEELNGSSLNITLNISDADEPNAQYTVDFYSGITGDGERASRVNELRQNLIGDGNVAVTINTEQETNSYYVIRVRQNSIDPVNGSDINDAWLAPIWVEDILTDEVEEHSAQFTSSRNSNLYHYVNCRFVGQIAAHNLLYHDSALTGKSLHLGCPQ